MGLDYSSAVYHAVSEQGDAYLVKVTSRSLYEPQYLVPRYLNDQGITGVVAPISTGSGALWTYVEDWTVVLYPFIDGDSSFEGMTAEQWSKLGAILQRIHKIIIPPEGGMSLREETFDPTEYVRWIRTFEEQLARFEGGSTLDRTLHASWIEHRLTILSKLTALEKLAGTLQSRKIPHVICHADLHPANVIRDQAGQLFVIDWDEVMLAPKERDFIFVGHPHAQAFFEGYGAAEVDEEVLAYYRLERVLQDLIECARNVWIQDDLGEETKAEALKLFQTIVAAEASR
ncbi:aminoglycoside phosphotransferase family protein [Paenibacillus lignilyticus]|uniref:Aminoglycoside phosphotransferase family protein n=1 Tax=Paenibacillus lignilyticus TaxID=1172615 RepID=A0ABS5CKY3_9BACL|nr:aminoglycoside phosphotransferase family protein [Paenibacillus lignilyticus]MBP3966515.1 aminoglycoside phosphotransferase family protein [Paenibacillus lignilyticus]